MHSLKEKTKIRKEIKFQKGDLTYNYFFERIHLIM